jgi:AbrB family looped-hinge helix DNA binding protein
VKKEMLAELKDRSQVTIPKSVVQQLGLQTGDQFEIDVQNGEILLVPVVVYPKAKIVELEALAAQATKELEEGRTQAFNTVEDLVADLQAGA